MLHIPLLLVLLVSVCGSDIIPPHPSSPRPGAHQLPTRASLTTLHHPPPLTLNHLQQGQYCSIDDMFCIPANYSKFNPPLNPPGEPPAEVQIGLDNFEILKIDDREFTIEINAYFIVKWRDKRIEVHSEAIDYHFSELGHDSTDWVPVELELVDRLWIPDAEILRLKGFTGLSVLNKLQGLWMSKEREVLYVTATRIRFMCPMNFNKFPMDTQTCKFQVGSFNYDNTKMVYRTYYLPLMPNSTESILDYEVEIASLKIEDTFYLPAETGNYSVAGFEMVLNRKVAHYMITYYLPSSLFVVVSWASFLIPSDDIQGRMALLITLFLVLVNIFNAITTNSPKADGLNALQAWVIACIFFIFGALFEYSVILLRMKIKTIRQIRKCLNGNLAAYLAPLANPLGANMANGNACGPSRQNQGFQGGTQFPAFDPTSKVDLVFLCCFPCLFLIFSIVYVIAFYF